MRAALLAGTLPFWHAGMLAFVVKIQGIGGGGCGEEWVYIAHDHPQKHLAIVQACTKPTRVR
jgi:hypothetical protein